MGVFRHPAAEKGPGGKGLGGGEIIVREWVARQVAESERSEPAAEVEGTPEQEGRSRCAVPLEEGGRACLAEAEEGSPGGGQEEEGDGGEGGLLGSDYDSDDNSTAAQVHRFFAKVERLGIDLGEDMFSDPWA